VIVRDIRATIDPELLDAIVAERYKDRRHLSTREFDDEPWEAIWMATTLWAADAKRQDKDNKPRA
jgi:hypothetical protein